MFRDSIASVLGNRPDIEVVATAATGAQTLAALAAHLPDVVVVDYGLPDINGIEIVRRACRARPELRAILLSGTEAGPGLIRLGVLAGCSGVLQKSHALALLAAAIDLAANGAAVTTREALSALAGASESPDVLTGRQIEVLALAAEGYGTKEIAKYLGVSNDSVRNNLQRSLTKLGAHSRLEAVNLARRLGLI